MANGVLQMMPSKLTDGVRRQGGEVCFCVRSWLSFKLPSHTLMGWNSRWQCAGGQGTGYGMLHGFGRFELSILFNAQGLPEAGGSVQSRVHHLTLEFADLFSFKFPPEFTFDQMMHASIASFASLGLHSSLLVPFKRTLAVRLLLNSHKNFQLILQFASFHLFCALDSPQALLSASILASQTYHFLECSSCFRFALSLVALSPTKACVEPGCPNLVGFKSQPHFRVSEKSRFFESCCFAVTPHFIFEAGDSLPVAGIWEVLT